VVHFYVLGEGIAMRYLLLSLLFIFTIPSFTSAGFREVFAKEFLTTPWAGEQVERNACIDCHSSENMKPALQGIVDQWKSSWHAQNAIYCHDCHGGDPDDASLAMARHERGFMGKPGYEDIPEFCGKCHVAILKHYQESGHSKALKNPTRRGPNCIICHGSHNIQKASINIINEQRCTQCHTYERAKEIKQVLFLTEKKITNIDKDLMRLRDMGVYAGKEEKELFRTHVDFRTIFHEVNVNLIRNRTDEFSRKLGLIEDEIKSIFHELDSRRNFSAFLMILFAGMGIVVFLLSQISDD
jgi:nitrate/TMAO reductase-like tetraheme cytochrome c subunit